VIVVLLLIAGVKDIVHALEGPHTVPDVRNMSLSAAKMNLHDAGLGYTYDSNQGTFGIVAESDWVVCDESPAPGTKTKSKVWLDVRRFSC